MTTSTDQAPSGPRPTGPGATGPGAIGSGAIGSGAIGSGAIGSGPTKSGAARSRVAATGKARRATLGLRRVHPWSACKLALVVSLALAALTVGAAAALYAGLSAVGVTSSVNALVGSVRGGAPVLTLSSFVGGAAILAATNVVLLTALVPLGAGLYNVCASFTGGLEVTLVEPD